MRKIAKLEEFELLDGRRKSKYLQPRICLEHRERYFNSLMRTIMGAECTCMYMKDEFWIAFEFLCYIGVVVLPKKGKIL